MFFLTTAYAQTVYIINNNQPCLPQGQAAVLTGSVTGLGQGGHLQCLKWTSDNPQEVIANDWQSTVTVNPQKTTTYTLSIMQGATVIASDKVRVAVDVLSDFDLPCAMDTLANRKIKIKDIAAHVNKQCLNGIVYTPDEIELGPNEAKRTWTVTATHNGISLSDTITLINSAYTLIGYKVVGTNDGRIKIIETAGNVQDRLILDLRAMRTLPKNIGKVMNKFPVSLQTGANFAFSGGGKKNYALCPGGNPCYGISTSMSFGGAAEVNAELQVSMPTIIAGLYGAFTFYGRGEIDADLVNACGNNKVCISPEFFFDLGGSLGAYVGAGVVKIDGGIVGGLTASGNFCWNLPNFNGYEWQLKAGTRDTSVRGRVILGWGLHTKEIRYVLIKGNPCKWSWPN